VSTPAGHAPQSRRYGAVARWQSVSIIDRTWGSAKREYLGTWILLLPLTEINEAISRYSKWFGHDRPHQGLGGSTPDEVFHRRRRRRRSAHELRDLNLMHFARAQRLPVYRRVLAA
jgi:hypothetical protein